jgi:hypothetical protein
MVLLHIPAPIAVGGHSCLSSTADSRAPITCNRQCCLEEEVEAPFESRSDREEGPALWQVAKFRCITPYQAVYLPQSG